MRTTALTAVRALVVLTLLLGVAYPLAVTGLGHLLMPDRASGSILTHNGRPVGSRLLAQDTRRPVLGPDGQPRTGADGAPRLRADARYFQPRPSVTGYAADATAFSNRGPNTRASRDAVVADLRDYLDRERPYSPGLSRDRVPVDAVTDSGSGVDPDVSVANARIQAHRIAAVRGLPLARVQALVAGHTQRRALGVLGEPAVNVLTLNLALDAQRGRATRTKDGAQPARTKAGAHPARTDRTTDRAAAPRKASR